uniref:Uncharacterized protein n=1 Tax=Setaria viridis TaxID=4556 RepID=A0A4U6TD70_SETVI|nr:hypothetical protein SEVIR_8G083933v2 [Setaria viridis]
MTSRRPRAYVSASPQGARAGRGAVSVEVAEVGGGRRGGSVGVAETGWRRRRRGGVVGVGAGRPCLERPGRRRVVWGEGDAVLGGGDGGDRGGRWGWRWQRSSGSGAG